MIFELRSTPHSSSVIIVRSSWKFSADIPELQLDSWREKKNSEITILHAAGALGTHLKLGRCGGELPSSPQSLPHSWKKLETIRIYNKDDTEDAPQVAIRQAERRRRREVWKDAAQYH